MFAGTKTLLKPEGRARYVVPQRRDEKTGQLVYYLTPELEEKFRKLYPTTMNRDMMRMFGLSFSTLQRFKRQLGLQKNERVIRKKLAKMVKEICEENGYYDSIRGKAPSQASIEGTKRMWASGFHPLKVLKKRNPRKYKRCRERRSEMRKKLIEKERKRIVLGLDQKSRLHLPQIKFTRSQLCRRHNALKRGYILGDLSEDSGERYTIFYDEETMRGEVFEKNCKKDGFVVRKI